MNIRWVDARWPIAIVAIISIVLGFILWIDYERPLLGVFLALAVPGILVDVFGSFKEIISYISNHKMRTGAILCPLGGSLLLAGFAVFIYSGTEVGAKQLASFIELRNIDSSFLILCPLIGGLALLLGGAVFLTAARSTSNNESGSAMHSTTTRKP